jgi:3D (Asp-Asp-Asp) domain-containing protein
MKAHRVPTFIRCVKPFLAVALAAICTACSTTGDFAVSDEESYKGPRDKHGMPTLIPKSGQMTVRTTAYTHTEADSLKYGKKTAAGTILKYGKVKSAAADWSRFPYGTIFKIAGDSTVYQIDDYGSALVGTNTIDLYKPSKSSMRHWGVRKVDIKILRWGSYQKSLDIMEERTRHRHVGTMVAAINRKLRKSS